MGTKKRGGSTRPSKVYAKRERTADFLLDEGSVESNPKASEVGLKLFGRLENDASHPKATSGLRVGGNVVNINGFPSPDLASLQGLAIDNRIGLARANAIGIDPDGKEAKEGETDLLMGHVDRVGIRKQREAVVPREILKERFRMDRIRVKGAIPNLAELVEGERSAETFC